MKYLNRYSVLAIALIAFIFTSCEDNETVNPEEAPRAIFGFDAANDDSGMVSFSNFSIGGESYIWNFGDGGTSTEENPVYTYSSGGKYEVNLTVINTAGEASTTSSVSISKNILVGGDMSDETAWTFKQVWNDLNNQVISNFNNGVFLWDAADGTNYAQTYLYQEVAIEAGKTYKFSADIAASAGTQGIWFELYFGNVDPETDGDYGSNGRRLYVSSFDSADSGCANDPFDGDFVSLGQGCDNSGDDKRLSSDGTFTLTADELTSNGTIFLVFKSGIWDSLENYKDGITLDNVAIREIFQ